MDTVDGLVVSTCHHNRRASDETTASAAAARDARPARGADLARWTVGVGTTLGASATAALLAGCTTDRTTDVSICTARPTDIGVAGITAMSVNVRWSSFGAVARATLKVRSTGATARQTADAGHGDGVADLGAALGVAAASARARDTAGAVITCLAGGAAGRAAPTAEVIATRLARAVRRAARCADTHLARRTRKNTGADAIARQTLAGIAGSIQTDRATRLSSRAARVIYTGIAGITATPIAAGPRATVLVSCAGTAGR